MRKLAQELGVEAMSLYNHVDNKEDIVGGILGLVASEIELPPEGTDWKAALRRRAISAHDAFRRHRWAAGLWMSSRGGDGSGMKDGDAILRCFREAGFSKDVTYHAFHVFNGYVLGFTLQEQNFPYDGEQLEEMAAKFLRSSRPTSIPTSTSTSSSTWSRATATTASSSSGSTSSWTGSSGFATRAASRRRPASR